VNSEILSVFKSVASGGLTRVPAVTINVGHKFQPYHQSVSPVGVVTSVGAKAPAWEGAAKTMRLRMSLRSPEVVAQNGVDLGVLAYEDDFLTTKGDIDHVCIGMGYEDPGKT
jgi:hypothetical protein